MSDLYTRLAQTAVDQIADKGRLMTLEKATTSFDDQTSIASQSSQAVSVKAVMTALKLDDAEFGTVEMGDQKVLIAGASLSEAPDNSYKLIDQGKTWNVQEVIVVQPGDVPLLYKLQVRR